MSENRYRGWATLIDRGFEIVVHADLATRGSPGGPLSWGGHVQADRDEDFELMEKVREGRLRMPEGGEAAFVEVATDGSGGLDIVGRSAAPF
ncbi:DUF4873 domain-containing protein [Kitasatospora acidiphila]|uniref:DUF4873 domain-containing protein n=1 Tax=Kitasatospora acidiphila TaxID=2567942 RepID=UPI0015F0AEB5|nr:DUF4873 domain-containing protein [Kitasatospora acidiphila]